MIHSYSLIAICYCLQIKSPPPSGNNHSVAADQAFAMDQFHANALRQQQQTSSVDNAKKENSSLFFPTSIIIPNHMGTLCLSTVHDMHADICLTATDKFSVYDKNI